MIRSRSRKGGSLDLYYRVLLLVFPFMLLSSITGMDLCLILLFLGWLVERLRGDRAWFPDPGLAALVGVFLVLLLIPEVLNFRWEGLEELVIHHFRKIFLLIVLVDVLRSRASIESSTKAWVAAAALASLLTAVALFTEWEWMARFWEPVPFESEASLRGSGPGHWKANQFANVLAMVFPFAFFGTFRAVSTRRSPNVFLWGLGTVLIAAGVFASASRGPWFAIMAVILISAVGYTADELTGKAPGFIVRAITFRRVLLGLLVVAVLAGLALSLPAHDQPFLWDRFKDLLSRDTLDHLGLARRLELWRSVIRQAYEAPNQVLWGAGSERGMEHFRLVADRPLEMVHGLRGSGVVRDHAHNNLIQYLLDYGVFGLTAYVAFWVVVVRRLIDPPAGLPRHDVYVGLSLVLIFNLNGLTEYNWGRSPSHYNIIFGLGLVLAAWNLEASSSGRTGEAGRTPTDG